MDRDVHAALNMVWFFKNKIGMDHIDLKRVEIETLVNELCKKNINQLPSTKHEATNL